ncbi:hypothetical protein EVAR_31093_1 [Eumeta japonica]|uniref:Uncharacterized protein n=1 Tax=Eumeta variegata TaxID=151549 RepID=A0A4C2AC46_EUMVA|nr:hypothetical protein EVAR_31093_1 [Eumeta japonica]
MTSECAILRCGPAAGSDHKDWILTEGALIDEFSTRVELTHVLRASERAGQAVGPGPYCAVFSWEVIISQRQTRKMPSKARLPRYRFRSEYLQAHDLQVVVQGDRCWATSPMQRVAVVLQPALLAAACAAAVEKTVAVPLSPRLRRIISLELRENVL